MDRPDARELNGERIPGHYIVVLESSVQDPGSVARAQTESRDAELGFVYSHALKGYSAELSRVAVQELRKSPNVKYITPELKVEGTAQTIPTGISRTFASGNPALDIDETDDARINVDVAVIDSGIDQNHSELNLVARTDCTIGCLNGVGTDEAGHGTHVAGTIGAIDNAAGVVGMAPGARLWSVRVLDASNSGTSGWVIAGVDWVTARASEIEVANMSLAGWGHEPALEEAIDKAIDKGVVVVVAAGNSAFQAQAFWPANDPDVITVSAIADYDGKPGAEGSPTCVWMGNDEELGWYSNWGGVVDIAAPGTCILSSVPGGGYASYYGTSMATPHVTGAAAVLASKSNPSNRAGVEALRDQLRGEGSLSWIDTSGDISYEPLLYAGEKSLPTSEGATAGFDNTDGSTVVLHGAVSTHGQDTEYQFEYGTTTEYGSEIPASPKKLSGSQGYAEVGETIAGLKPDQTYHYRLTATSSSGTVHGEDKTFVPSRWVKDSPERISGFDWMYDTSCVVDGKCMAVGYAYYNGQNRQASYQYDSGKWTYKTLPIPAEGWSPEPIGVSCTASNACTAVGHYFLGNDVKVLVERWNGSSWSPETVPAPYSGAPFTRGRSVSCVSSSECLAVGSYVDPSGVLKNWSGRWKGGSWSNLATPSVEGAEESMLEDVSCASASFCMAAGWAYDEGVGYKPVSMAWNGTSWELLNPARSSGTAGSVSCTSATFCMTAGYGLSSELWDGEQWTYKEPASAFSGYLTSVSCSTPNYCTAVGRAKGLKYFGITEVWNGSSWSLLPPSMEGDVVHSLNGVSCTGLSGCTGVGEFNLSSTEGLFEHRDDVSTNPTSNLGPTKATVNGSINPGGISTSYYFEYGPTTSYGSKAPVSEGSAGSGTMPVDVSEQITELDPETLYHYRLVATNTSEKGQKVTAYGKDRTFRTPGSAPAFSASVGSFGSGDGQFHTPLGVAVDSAGNVWAADAANHRIQKFNSKGEFLAKFGSFGTGNGQFNTPAGVAIESNGDLLVTDSGNSRIQRFNSKGEYLGKFGAYGLGDGGQLVEPGGIAVDSAGNVWVADHLYYRVVEFNSKGEYVRTIRGSSWPGGSGPELGSPTGVAVDPEGHIWVTDLAASKVLEYSSTGTFLSQFGIPGVGQGEIAEPGAIAFEAGNMWIGDRSGRIQKFTQSGEYLAQFSGVSEPGGIAPAPGGVLWTSSTIHVNRIEKWQLPVPVATTSEATSVTNTQAELKGVANPSGLPTKYCFEFGTTTSYGSSIPASSKSIGSGNTPVAVSEVLTELVPGQTYHYRLAATSYYGTTYGADQSFTPMIGIADKLAGMAVTEAFNGGTTSISNFESDWSALGWAAGSPAKGANTSSGWRPVAAYPTVNGAYYGSILTDSGAGLASMATMAANPSGGSRYFSVWLDMPAPAGTKAGYELRFTYVSANNYNVSLVKWQGGSSTTLVSKSNQAFANGNSFALVDAGATVSAWINTGSGFSQLLSASDSTYSAGSAGVEGSGNITRLTNFKAASLLTPVASMDAALNELALNDSFGNNEDPLSGGGAWAALFWDNSTSGHNTGRVSGGWGPYDAYPTVNGAFWTVAPIPDTGSGIGVAATLQARPGFASRYFSLWLEMPSPASEESGYEARFTETSANTYEVVLARWQAGAKTALATKSGFAFPVGSKFALVDKGASVAIWTKTATEYGETLSASDSSFKTGYTGIEGSGNVTRLKDFRSGPLPPF